MDSLLYAKPLSIQQHSNDIREEARTARLLCDQLRLAPRLAGPADLERYDTLIRQAEQITAYLQSMADTVDMMSTDLVRLSNEIGLMLEDSRNWHDGFGFTV